MISTSKSNLQNCAYAGLLSIGAFGCGLMIIGGVCRQITILKIGGGLLAGVIITELSHLFLKTLISECSKKEGKRAFYATPSRALIINPPYEESALLVDLQNSN